MDPLGPSVRVPVRQSLWRFIHDRNPFYLLSALCMFVGFRVIIEGMEAKPGDWKTLLFLIFTLDVYEAMLIALALFLIVRRGLHRDGWILLSIEALFLVDLTNLNAELFTAAPRLGSFISGICFPLALVKIGVVVRCLRLRLTPGTMFYIAIQFAFMLGLPGIFRLLRSPAGAVSPVQIYAVWWMVGLLIAAGSILVKRSSDGQDSPMATLPWRLYILMPLISLLVHLCSENRVFWVHFQAANVGPVMLGFAVVASRSAYCRQRGNALRVALLLAALAVSVSIVPPIYHPAMTWHIGTHRLSPLRLDLLGSVVLMAWLAYRHRSLITAQGASACFVMAGLGASPREMAQHAHHVLNTLISLARSMVPQTSLQWGYIAIGSAFILLAVGAVVSLKKPEEQMTR